MNWIYILDRPVLSRKNCSPLNVIFRCIQIALILQEFPQFSHRWIQKCAKSHENPWEFETYSRSRLSKVIDLGVNWKHIRNIDLFSISTDVSPTVFEILMTKPTLCSEKNTHSHFVSYLHELFVDLNTNCSEYTQGLIDSDKVKIRYSLQSMT